MLVPKRQQKITPHSNLQYKFKQGVIFHCHFWHRLEDEIRIGCLFEILLSLNGRSLKIVYMKCYFGCSIVRARNEEEKKKWEETEKNPVWISCSSYADKKSQGVVLLLLFELFANFRFWPIIKNLPKYFSILHCKYMHWKYMGRAFF